MTTNPSLPAANPFNWPPDGECGWLDGTCTATPVGDDWLCPTHRDKVMYKPVSHAEQLAATVAAMLES